MLYSTAATLDEKNFSFRRLRSDDVFLFLLHVFVDFPSLTHFALFGTIVMVMEIFTVCMYMLRADCEGIEGQFMSPISHIFSSPLSSLWLRNEIFNSHRHSVGESEKERDENK
jgi:hypothetical protein